MKSHARLKTTVESVWAFGHVRLVRSVYLRLIATMTEIAKTFPEVAGLTAGWRVTPFCEKAPMSRAKFWRLVKKGEIRTIKYGSTTIIPADEVERIFTHGTGKAA
jgi:hypothetical protein